ncbi:hypothetical protein NHG22_03625 [Streptomyces sp. ATE26]|uniref:hypothetical protein n=1 Tax=Streptomyces sp. ATE26 TaxID=2954237 RepID=UPI0024822BFC|nr:hypothetical protein [Streptomyces sp. ATE26]MDI1452921.1 hypothetical protein [Streptomyces sp. ATE26]
MQTEVLVGLIGFGGALVGAGGALLGGWLQQRHQAAVAQKQQEAARAGLLEEQGRAAGEKALSELYALRRHLRDCELRPVPEECQPWRGIARGFIDEAELAVMLMPNATEVQSRITDAAGLITETLMIGREEAQQMTDREHITHVHRCRAGTLEASEAISAFTRGDSLSETGPLLRRHITQHPRSARSS